MKALPHTLKVYGFNKRGSKNKYDVCQVVKYLGFTEATVEFMSLLKYPPRHAYCFHWSDFQGNLKDGYYLGNGCQLLICVLCPLNANRCAFVPTVANSC